MKKNNKRSLIISIITFILLFVCLLVVLPNQNYNKLILQKNTPEDFYLLSEKPIYKIDINQKIDSKNHILEPGSEKILDMNDFEFEINKYYYINIVGNDQSDKMRTFLGLYTYRNNNRIEDFFIGINSPYNIVKLTEEYDKLLLNLSYYGTGKISINKIEIYEINGFIEYSSSIGENINTNTIDFEAFNGLIGVNPPNLSDLAWKKIYDDLKDYIFIIDNRYDEVDFSDEIIWDDSLNDDRTYLLSLHGFRTFPTYKALYEKLQEPVILKNYYYLIEDWIDNNVYISTESNLAYNDMAIAFRIFNWLHFYDVANSYLTESQKNKIIDSLNYQVYLLRQPQLYTIGTNHGLYQDISYMIYHYYFVNKSHSREIEIAFKNIEFYFETVISPLGVHLEHSPSYHLMMVNTLKKSIPIFRKFNLKVKKLQQVLNDMSNYAMHILKPDGILPQIGDTERTQISPDFWDSDEYIYSASVCKEGSVPKENNVVFPDSGYAIFRDDWNKCENATYVLFYNHYSSYYHKHSDELGLWIFRDGDIIREAGRGGYQYTDPFTKYAYSSWGHNTLIVNNVGLVENRNIPNDYNYGGTYIKDYSINNPNDVWVLGVNERYKDVVHERQVNFQKNIQNVSVIDTINSNNKNDYTLLWHLSKDIKPILDGNKIKLYRKGTYIMDIDFISENDFSINIINAQKKPMILGWHFDNVSKPEGNSTIKIDFKGIKGIELITNFKFKYD